MKNIPGLSSSLITSDCWRSFEDSPCPESRIHQAGNQSFLAAADALTDSEFVIFYFNNIHHVCTALELINGALRWAAINEPNTVFTTRVQPNAHDVCGFKTGPSLFARSAKDKPDLVGNSYRGSPWGLPGSGGQRSSTKCSGCFSGCLSQVYKR